MKDTVSIANYIELLEIQKNLNKQLRNDFESEKFKGREHLASFLVNRVEQLVDELNEQGHRFGRCDYSGDINFENSEQTYSNGKSMGEGAILHFHGYSVLAYWEGRDKYA